MLNWLTRRLRVRHPSNRVLGVSAEGAELRDTILDECLWQVKWANVEEVVVFKVDALTTDHLCLGFREAGSTAFHATDEDTPGWQDLNKQLEVTFGIVFDEWFHAVAFPAFKTNRTVLWQRMAV